MKKQKGFTLIELLLVISVIGILSGVVLGIINVPEIRKKARDSQRISDVKKIQVALEFYFSDNVRYPLTASYSTLATEKYIDALPVDPSTKANYFYESSDGTYYYVVAGLELTSNANGVCRTSGYSNCYGVTNP